MHIANSSIRRLRDRGLRGVRYRFPRALLECLHVPCLRARECVCGFVHRFHNMRTYDHVAVSTSPPSGMIFIVAHAPSTLFIIMRMITLGPRRGVGVTPTLGHSRYRYASAHWCMLTGRLTVVWGDDLRLDADKLDGASSSYHDRVLARTIYAMTIIGGHETCALFGADKHMDCLPPIPCRSRGLRSLDTPPG